MRRSKMTLLIVLFSAPAFANPAPPAPVVAPDMARLAEQIRQLEQRIARLERRLGEDLAATGMRAVRGIWQVDGERLVSPDDPVAILQLPYNPPEEYILSMRVRRIAGNNTFAIGLPMGGRQVLLALDAHASNVSGLEYLDGRYVHENEATYRGALFAGDKEATIVCTIRKDRITCAFDDVKVVNWQGDPQRRLSLPEIFAVPDRNALFLTTLTSRYEIREIKLTPLTFPAG
jgi:hypothetical protein